MTGLFSSRVEATLAFASLMAFVPLLAFAATSSTISVSVTPTISTGTAALSNEIAAQQARLTQLTEGAAPSPGIMRTLRSGSRGKDVQLLQDFLKLYGTFSTTTVSTGFFGPRTSQAVKEFQRKEFLDSVGIVGPKTRARIHAFSAHELLQKNTAVAASSSVAVPPQITNVVFSSDVNEDGSGNGSSSAFASTTQNIYATLALSHARQDTAIGFIRYYNGAYLDSAVTHPSRTGLQYLHVQWSQKPDKNRIPGAYTVAWYVNGAKATTTAFDIN